MLITSPVHLTFAFQFQHKLVFDESCSQVAATNTSGKYTPHHGNSILWNLLQIRIQLLNEITSFVMSI